MPVTQPLLSICIPTFNFGRFIGETLESVLAQATPEIDVVVLDSASTDDTPQVIARMQTRYPQLRYERAGERRGIDRDMAAVVGLATGRYCWLFSADDVMEPGSISRVLREIESDLDVYVCQHSNCTLTMQVTVPRHPVLATSSPETFEMGDALQRRRYFQLAVTTEAFFSFMSGLIVKKAVWDRIPLNEDFVGSCWAHVARLFELSQRGLSVHYFPFVLLNKRGENDSFSSSGVVKRYALAVQGFGRLAARFWGANSEEAFHIRRVLRGEFCLRLLMQGKHLSTVNPAVESRALLDDVVAAVYSDRSLGSHIRRSFYRVVPGALVPLLRPVWHVVDTVRQLFASRT